MPGTLLRSGRYRLHELRSHQEWLSGAYEAVWIAQDAQRSGTLVTMCELVIPGQDTVRAQSLLRTSTMALTSIGRHPCVPTLWDAFIYECCVVLFSEAKKIWPDFIVFLWFPRE